MSKLSFSDFILSHSAENSREGDFIKDAKWQKEVLDVSARAELLTILERLGASSSLIDSAKRVWSRYEVAKSPIPMPLQVGLTVGALVELLAKEDQDAHVISYNPDLKTHTARVMGVARVTIENGNPGEFTPAIMLAG
jgi:hypothetical protein